MMSPITRLPSARMTSAFCARMVSVGTRSSLLMPPSLRSSGGGRAFLGLGQRSGGLLAFHALSDRANDLGIMRSAISCRFLGDPRLQRGKEAGPARLLIGAS
jgi:hypothetical protein